MRRQAIVLAVCVALSVPVLPGGALAGERLLTPARGHFQAISEFRPKSAFGSPGGFPFSASHWSPALTSAGHLSHRFSHQPFFPRFGSLPFPYTSTAFYTPTALYSPAAFYAPPAVYDPPAYSSPPAVTVSPVVYVSPTVYVSPSPASSPPAPVAAAPPAPPSQPSVVEYPTGRYELRGDGVATPYVWVWIPNPPPAPPASAPSSPAGPPTAVPAGRTPTYRWTDDE